MLILISFINLIQLINVLIVPVRSNDVLGCGGFLKSHVPIDFTKVEVKLVSKQGIVKDRTFCAPNNGYYFVPIYEKGELKLEISPPPGWSFTPKEVQLNVDGKTDPCSSGKDINFNFEGFGITGRVESLGAKSGGPQAVNVTLFSEKDTRSTQTLQNGIFSFSPVHPGSYKVTIQHATWKLEKDSVDVLVTQGNTELPSGSLIIRGYEVRGKIFGADGKPSQDTIIGLFLLNREESHKNRCNKNVDNVGDNEENFLCFTNRTDKLGEFYFAVVSSGDYFAMPIDNTKNIHYQPEKLKFSVEHSNVKLSENFQIVGFTIQGVVKYPTNTNNNNKPIRNAQIFLNNVAVTKSNDFGKYKLEKLKLGKYTLKAEAENLLFNELEVDVDANLRNLPDFIPSAIKICGKIISSDHQQQRQRVIFTHLSTQSVISCETNETQQFCQYLSVGNYRVHVEVDKENALKFYPLSQKIQVSDDTSAEIVFSELKANISGKVHCIKSNDCQDLNINLKNNFDEIYLSIKDNRYSATDILPGVYTVTISENNLCWKNVKQTIEVNAKTVEIPPFIQTGYPLKFSSTNEAIISYKELSPEGKLISFPIMQGVTKTCLSAPGEYLFTIASCHEFGKKTLKFSIPSKKNRNEINLKAQKHSVEFAIQSDGKDYGPIDITIQLGDKKFFEKIHFRKTKYEMRLMLKPLQTAILTPRSDKLIFTPKKLQLDGGMDCLHVGDKFKANLGKIFEGKIQPPLGDVLITVEMFKTKQQILKQQTGTNGLYKFPPLDANFEYKIMAKKDSYKFIGPDKFGVFHAQKLAEINVEVLDEDDKTPLLGVLLTLSGGESYRKNQQTNVNGKITFHSLSASEYFIRPMMKEYRFEPASKIISVKEGEAIKVILTGKRVAFSAFGTVLTVNGGFIQNVKIIARGTENCTGLSEEATTDRNGTFRIRGLQPYCGFNISVQVENNAVDASSRTDIERTSPEFIQLEHVQEDIKKLNLTVFRSIHTTDVLLKISADKFEHYRYLRMKFYREDPIPTQIFSTLIDSLRMKVEKNQNYGILIHLPTLALDYQNYSIHLEPIHTVKGKSVINNFSTNSPFKFIDMKFIPKARAKEQPIKQTSIWTVVAFLIIFLICFNIQLILTLLKDYLNFNFDAISSYIPILATIINNKKTVDDYDNEKIDQIVKDINSVKKHKSSKKVL